MDKLFIGKVLFYASWFLWGAKIIRGRHTPIAGIKNKCKLTLASIVTC